MSTWGKVARAVALLTGVLTILLIAFALPAQHLSPRHLPVAVAGPQAAADPLVQRLQAARPGAFRFDRVADADAARARILDRRDYGALVVDPGGVRVLTAGAAGPAVAQVLSKLAGTLQPPVSGAVSGLAGAPVAVPVADVAPLPARDPTGAGLAGGALPLVLGGWVGALVILALVRGTAQRLVAGFSFAVIGAAVFIAVEKYWFGAVTGSYAPISAGVALGIAATAWTVLGLRSALGGRGMAVAAVIVMLLGYPLCGLTSAPELLPAPLGALGQLLPPGAACTLLRSTAFFHGHGGARPVAVLGCWLVGGLLLFVLGESRARRRTAAPAPAQAAALVPA